MRVGAPGKLTAWRLEEPDTLECSNELLPRLAAKSPGLVLRAAHHWRTHAACCMSSVSSAAAESGPTFSAPAMLSAAAITSAHSAYMTRAGLVWRVCVCVQGEGGCNLEVKKEEIDVKPSKGNRGIPALPLIRGTCQPSALRYAGIGGESCHITLWNSQQLTLGL